jgi:hypothetical protein
MSSFPSLAKAPPEAPGAPAGGGASSHVHAQETIAPQAGGSSSALSPGDHRPAVEFIAHIEDPWSVLLETE